jgi:hypothetical protein
MLRKKKDEGNKKSNDQLDENQKEKAQEKDSSETKQEEFKTTEAQANQARLHALRDKFLVGEITEQQYLKVRKNILRGD